MSHRELPPRPRSAPAKLDPEDFDEIREAVMETSRGRWFLDEFATRLRTAETASLRDGMTRLETTIASNHDSLMSRLARVLEQEPEDDIAPPPRAPGPDMRLAPRHMKYYRADEDLFEPAPEATIAAVPRLLDMLPPEPEVATPRHRIVVIRHKPGEPFDVPLADERPRVS